jgi:assimilatory nitrate reductase catalytic subunit
MGEPQQERRLFADGSFFTPDQKARFQFEDPRPLPEPASAQFPFTLLTGRGTSAQWHTQSRTSKSEVLRRLYPARPYVEIHPSDARHLNLKNGASVEISSLRGTITADAFLTKTVQAGTLFMPMHYPETNLLTAWNVDPFSRQPAYKACAVALSPSP